MSEWINVDPNTLVTSSTDRIGSVGVLYGISPFEIPEKVSGHYDSSGQQFVVQFQYPDGSEPTVRYSPSSVVNLEVGQQSGCLHEVHFKASDLLTFRTIGPKEFWQAIGKLEHDPRLSARVRQFRVAGQVIDRNLDRLTAEG